MKTVRQLLLEGHESDEERLNAVTQSVVRELSRAQGPAEDSRVQPANRQAGVKRWLTDWTTGAGWRWYWRGLAAAWLFVIALHLGSLGNSLATHDAPSAKTREITPETLELLRQQRALREELIRPAEFAQETKLPTPLVPGPRSALPVGRVNLRISA